MKQKYLYTKLTCLFTVFILTVSCTDLNVVPYREITAENFYTNRLEIQAAVMRPYTHANAWAAPTGQMGHWLVSELSSDQLIWPQKGRHGHDGGQWGRLHYRSWSSTAHDGIAWDPWRLMFWGIGLINNTLHDLQHVVRWENVSGVTEADRAGFIGELRANRAWHYLKLMDLYGNIPIVRNVAGIGGQEINPRNAPRAEVFAFIEEELLEIAGDMFPLSRELAGRVNRATVYAMLVELYLNAEVWTGIVRWNDAIYYATKLMNGEGGGMGTMALDPDIFLPFANNNGEVSTEGIFQIVYNRNQGMWLGRAHLGAYRESNILNTRSTDNGWNAIVVTPNAFSAFSENDLRRTNWMMYGIGDGWLQGPFKNIGEGRPDWDYVLGQEEWVNLPLIFAYQPIRAWYTVSGTSQTPIANRQISITRWESPEFPAEVAIPLMESAFNGRQTKQILVRNHDGYTTEDGTVVAPRNSVELSGSSNPRFRGMYDWTDLVDYRLMWEDATENIGARIWKYHSGVHTDSNYGNNNWNVYRLTWIYFAKAEAIIRKNGGTATQEAVDLINTVKSRAFTPEYWNSVEALTNGSRYTTTTLTLDELLAERSREFIVEGWRRQDLIRFGKWEFGIDGWWDSPSSGYGDGSGGSLVNSSHTRLFPIPYRARQANPNLSQNPGYN
ncbi:MAG: RagB/SusD family nutrient uptake outer membrane protein [Dysgonamonadaceae bacterium]|jgi:hypothetical protein|nr:RagB/SusD family nutrient uptake outer membrane protein [Dysgonamonadaceae bacterium]